MTIGSLFSGIGGLELGLERAGLGPVIWQAEQDPNCRAWLSHHWPSTYQYKDVKDVGRSRLTAEQSGEAVRMYESGLSCGDVAEFYGVTRQAMWDRLRRRTTMRANLRFGPDNHFYRGGGTAVDSVHNLTEKAIERGVLVRPTACSACCQSGEFKDGRTSIQAHHDDYNRPLSIRWLCQMCHHEWHKSNKPVAKKEVPAEPAQVDLICGGFPIGHVKTSAQPVKGQDSPGPGRVSGTSSSEQLGLFGPTGSSSKTCTGESPAGCPSCGATCGDSGMPLCAFECEPVTLEPVTNVRVGSLSQLPTLAARAWRDAGYPAEYGRSTSIPAALVESGELSRGRVGHLCPQWSAVLMGYPAGWLDGQAPVDAPESKHWATPWCPPAPKSSDV